MKHNSTTRAIELAWRRWLRVMPIPLKMRALRKQMRIAFEAGYRSAMELSVAVPAKHRDEVSRHIDRIVQSEVNRNESILNPRYSKQDDRLFASRSRDGFKTGFVGPLLSGFIIPNCIDLDPSEWRRV